MSAFDRVLVLGVVVGAMLGACGRPHHPVGRTGDPDVDFLMAMIPHHEGAVDMARAVLIRGEDPLTRQLAEELIASQSTEIEAMRQRLAILRTPVPEAFPALHGTRGLSPPTTGR
jgi:hypothetical protein